MSTEAKRSIPVKITKRPEFTTLYASGIFGGLNPIEGRIVFYIDRPVPKMKETPIGAMEVSEVERELQVELHLSPATFIQMYEWMKSHIERLEKQGALVKEVKPEGLG